MANRKYFNVIDKDGNVVDTLVYPEGGSSYAGATRNIKSGKENKVIYNKDSENELYEPMFNKSDIVSSYPPSISIDEKGKITVSAPKVVLDSEEFKTAVNTETLKQASLAYKLNKDYRFPYQEYDEKTGKTTETEITVPEYIEKLNASLQKIASNIRDADEIRSYISENFNSKAEGLTDSQIRMSVDYKNGFIPIPKLADSLKGFKGISKYVKNGYISVEDFKKFYDLDNVGREEIATLLANLDNALKYGTYNQDEYYEGEDGEEVFDRYNANEMARAYALRSYILENDPNQDWWQSVGYNIESLATNALYGADRVFFNIANVGQKVFTLGQGTEVQNYIESMDEAYGKFNETNKLANDATAVTAFLGQIGGSIAGSVMSGKLMKIELGRLGNLWGKVGSAFANKYGKTMESAMKAAGIEAGSAAASALSQETIVALAVQNGWQIAKGAEFVVRMMPFVTQVNLVKNLAMAFVNKHAVLDYATKFLMDTFHDALVFDSTTLFHALESSDQDTRDYWMGQLVDNGKWWIGTGGAKWLIKFSGKTTLGQWLNAHGAKYVNKFEAWAGTHWTNFKNRINGGSLEVKLQNKLNDAIANNKPKKADQLLKKLQQLEFDDQLRNARRDLGNTEIKTKSGFTLKLTDDTIADLNLRKNAVRALNISIDNYNRGIDYKRQEMLGMIDDPYTGMRGLYVNPGLGGSNAKVSNFYFTLAKMNDAAGLGRVGDSFLSQEVIDYLQGQKLYRRYAGLSSPEAQDAAKVAAENLKLYSERIPEDIRKFIDENKDIYAEFYGELNDYAISHRLLDKNRVEGYNNETWKNIGGYQPIVVLGDASKNGRVRIDTGGDVAAVIDQEMHSLTYEVKPDQHFVDPELTRQSRINRIAQAEINRTMLDNYAANTGAAFTQFISGDETEYARKIKEGRKYVEKAVNEATVNFTEDFPVNLTETDRLPKTHKISKSELKQLNTQLDTAKKTLADDQAQLDKLKSDAAAGKFNGTNNTEIKQINDEIKTLKKDIKRMEADIKERQTPQYKKQTVQDFHKLDYETRKQMVKEFVRHNPEYIAVYRVQNTGVDDWYSNGRGVRGDNKTFNSYGSDKGDLKDAVWLTTDEAWAEGKERATAGAYNGTPDQIVVIPVKRSLIVDAGGEMPGFDPNLGPADMDSIWGPYYSLRKYSELNGGKIVQTRATQLEDKWIAARDENGRVTDAMRHRLNPEYYDHTELVLFKDQLPNVKADGEKALSDFVNEKAKADAERYVSSRFNQRAIDGIRSDIKTAEDYIKGLEDKRATVFADSLKGLEDKIAADKLAVDKLTARKAEVTNTTGITLARRESIVSNMTYRDTTDALVEMGVIYDGTQNMTDGVTADNFQDWYDNTLNNSSRDYIDNALADYGEVNYKNFYLAMKNGQRDFEYGLRRAFLAGSEEFAKSDMLKDAAKRFRKGRQAFADGVYVAKAKNKLSNIPWKDTDSFVDELYTTFESATDDYVLRLGQDAGIRSAANTMSRSSAANDIEIEHFLLKRLQANSDNVHASIDEQIESMLDGLDIDHTDAMKIKAVANELFDDYISSRVNDDALTIKDSGRRAIDAQEAYEQAREINDRIVKAEGETSTRYSSTGAIMYVDAAGRQAFATVDPAFASLYNRRIIIEGGEAGMLAKANAVMSKTFRYGTTSVNLASAGNQLFRDFGNAVLVGGAWRTIKQYADEMTDVFGEKIVEQIKRFDPTGYEIKQLTALAEQMGVDIDKAAVSRELMRGAAMAPSSTERTLYKNLWKELKHDSNVKLDDMNNKCKEILKKYNPDELINGTRENYLRKRVYAANLSDGLKSGYSVRDARIVAEFTMNNATTNFGRQLYHLQSIAESTPYFRAAINGTKSFWRMWSLDPVGISGRITGGLILPTMFLVGASLGTEENKKIYKNIPEYQKENSLVFVINGEIMSIPMPQELSSVVAPFRQFVEYLNDSQENDFWELMSNDLLGFLPIDLKGFTAIDMNVMTGDPTILDRANRGLSRVFSQVAPVPLKTIYMMATGTDPYTGKSMYDPSYWYWDDDEKSLALMDRSQNKFASLLAQTGLLGGNATVWEKVLSGIFGTSGADVLDDLAELFTEGPVKALSTTGENMVERVTDPFSVPKYNLVDSQWNAAVRGLTAEKDAILNNPKVIELNQKLAQEKDPEKRKELLAERQNYTADFCKKVAQTARRLKEVYGGDFDRYKLGAVVQLLNFDTDAVWQSGTQESSSDANSLFYSGRDAAIQMMSQMGIEGSDDLSVFGYVAKDKDGNPVVKYNTPITILDLKNQQLGESTFHLANIKSIVSQNNLYDQHQAVSDQISKIYNKAKKTNADYQAIEAIQINWNAVVAKTLAQYINKYSAEAAINNKQVRDYLKTYIEVPASWETNNKGRRVYGKTLGDKGSLKDAYYSSWLKSMFNVNDPYKGQY